MSKKKIPIEQVCGAWNRERQKRNLEKYREGSEV